MNWVRVFKETAYTASACLGLTRAAIRCVRRKALVLEYHNVNAGDSDPIRNLDGLHVRVSQFERQMDHLAAHYHVVPLDDLLDASAQMRRGKPRAAITFDDGYRDTYTYAVPILQRLGLPATVFIVTDFLVSGGSPWWDRLWAMVAAARSPLHRISVHAAAQELPIVTVRDKETAVRELTRALRELPTAVREAELSRLAAEVGVDQGEMKTHAPMSVSELRAMVDAGITVGSHGCSHDSFHQLGRERLREELAESKQVLESLTGRPVTWLSYPYGDFSADVAQMAAQAGYHGAVTTIEGLNDGVPDPYAIRRLGVDDRMSFAHFRVVVSGLRDVLKGRLRTDRGPVARRAIQYAQDETRSS